MERLEQGEEYNKGRTCAGGVERSKDDATWEHGGEGEG